MDEKDIMKILGEPEQHYRVNYFGRSLGSEWPEYTVTPALLNGIDWHKYVGDEIGVVGFEDSFLASNPPNHLRTPHPFSAPEILLLGVPGFGSDVWALACTIWDLRTDTHLFYRDHSWNTFRHAVWSIEYFLGPLQEPYKTIWEKCYAAFKRGKLRMKSPSRRPPTRMGFGNDDGQHYKPNPRRYIPPGQSGGAIEETTQRQATAYDHIPNEVRKQLNEEYDNDIAPQHRHRKETQPEISGRRTEYRLLNLGFERCPDRNNLPYCTSGFSERVLKFKNPFERELAKEWKHELRDPTPYDPQYDPDNPNWVDKAWCISDDEIPQLADLVSKAWKYDPAERADASSFLDHPWFKPMLEKKKKKKQVVRAEEIEGSWKNRLRPRKKRKVE